MHHVNVRNQVTRFNIGELLFKRHGIAVHGLDLIGKRAANCSQFINRFMKVRLGAAQLTALVN